MYSKTTDQSINYDDIMKYNLLRLLTLLCLLSGPISILAQFNPPLWAEEGEDNSASSDTDPSVDSFGSKVAHMLVILSLLIGFMILAAWMLKRMMNSRLTQINQTSVIKVIETRALSPRSSLYLLDINGQQILIAESHGGVNYLTAIDSENFEEELPEPYDINPT